MSDIEAPMASRKYTFQPARCLSDYFPTSSLLCYSRPSIQHLTLVQWFFQRRLSPTVHQKPALWKKLQCCFWYS